MQQQFFSSAGDYAELDQWFLNNGLVRVLLVCGKSIERQRIYPYLESIQKRLGVTIVRFSDFTPNPTYDSVCRGVASFRRESCQGMIAVGGGSAMDVAKCIKLYANMPGAGEDGFFLRQEIVPNEIPFLAMPTTAGTGSEATRFAVIYYDGGKQSIAHESCIPSAVLLDSSVLTTLPVYQKKSTMMDALCHAIESYWSVNSTEESRTFSREAIRQIMYYRYGYLSNSEEGNAGMLYAANTSGRAINITQTTAGHAMCYKITSLFGCAHGHAAALCNRVLYPWMTEHTEACIDPRGEAYLKGILENISTALGGRDVTDGPSVFNQLFGSLELEVPRATEEQFAILRDSVNLERLRNFPVTLDKSTIDFLYHQILRTAE